MSRRRWQALAVLAVSIGAAPAPAAEQPLDFGSAWARMETSLPELAAAQARLAQAEAALQQAEARRLPSVELIGRATHLDGPLEADLSRIGDVFALIGPPLGLPPDLLPPAYRIQERQFYNAALQATQPLYAGGRIRAGVQAASAGVDAALVAARQTLSEHRLLLLQRYFQAALAADALSLKEQTAASLTRHEDQALRLEEAGQIARAERLRASVALAEARNERDLARERQRLATQALAALIASPDSIRTLTPIPPLPEPPARAWLHEQVLSGSLPLGELRHRQRQAEAGMDAARGARRPTVGLFARSELYREDLTLIEPNWAVGIEARWTLYSGGQARARVAESAARLDELDQRLKAAERDLVLAVDQALEQLDGARSRHASLSATDELARESLRVQRRAFEEGMATSLDVIDAELALGRLQLGQASARLEAWLAYGRLMDLIGRAETLLQAIEETHADSSP